MEEYRSLEKDNGRVKREIEYIRVNSQKLIHRNIR